MNLPDANDVNNAIDRGVSDFEDKANEAKQNTEAAVAETEDTVEAIAEDAQEALDAATEEAQETLDAATTEAQKALRAIVAEAQSQATQIVGNAKRVTDAICRDAKRKATAASKDFQKRVTDLQRQVERDARNARSQISYVTPPNGNFVPEVASWLLSHPDMAGQITWQTTLGLPLPYPLWQPQMKNDLEQAFTKAKTGGSIMPVEPMDNSKSLDDEDPVVQILDHTDAWTMFVAYVAQSLAVEIGGRVQWSILEYSNTGLSELFHSTRMFVWNPFCQGYQIIERQHGSVLPCSPQTAWDFLLFNGFIDTSSRRNTIVNILSWCRDNLRHFEGDLIAGNVDDHWQYRGFAPVLRTLTGTPKTSDPSHGIRHRTAGCWGTVGFLRAILRTANIPVRLVNKSSRIEIHLPIDHTPFHALPHFVEDDLYLSHGDDPYSLLCYAIPPMPISELLIDKATYNEWFGVDEPLGLGHDLNTWFMNIGRRPKELAIQYLPIYLLQKYCDDMEKGRNHDDGEVFKEFNGLYTVGELEERDLWARMDARITSLGGCGAVQQIPIQ